MTTTALDLLLEDLNEHPWGTIRAQVHDRLVYAWLALKAAQEGTAPIGHAGEHISQAVAMLELLGERIKRLDEESFQDLLNSDEGVAAMASMAAEREAAKSEAT
ncbi:MAG TPA: hypothetical protein VF371_09565 [Candidatus Limnocylindrales bacterium]|jgi:hypothetical protein